MIVAELGGQLMIDKRVLEESYDTSFYNQIDDRSLVSDAVRKSQSVLNALILLEKILNKVSFSLIMLGAVKSGEQSDNGVLFSKLSPEFTKYLFDQERGSESLFTSICSNDTNAPEQNGNHPSFTFDDPSGKISIELERLKLSYFDVTKVKFGSQSFVFLTGYRMALKDRILIKRLNAICDCFITALGVKFRLDDILTGNNLNQPIGVKEYSITERQQQCLQWIAFGKTSYEISVILGLSEHTVNNYINNACKRLRAVTRAQAVIIAGQIGLIDTRL